MPNDTGNQHEDPFVKPDLFIFDQQEIDPVGQPRSQGLKPEKALGTRLPVGRSSYLYHLGSYQCPIMQVHICIYVFVLQSFITIWRRMDRTATSSVKRSVCGAHPEALSLSLARDAGNLVPWVGPYIESQHTSWTAGARLPFKARANGQCLATIHHQTLFLKQTFHPLDTLEREECLYKLISVTPSVSIFGMEPIVDVYSSIDYLFIGSCYLLPEDDSSPRSCLYTCWVISIIFIVSVSGYIITIYVTTYYITSNT